MPVLPSLDLPVSLPEWQGARLTELLTRVGATNRFWQGKFAQAGCDVSQVRTVADLVRLPFCTKAELIADQQAHPPYGTNLTEPVAHYSRLHQTSGTTGAPLRWLDTPRSWEALLGSWRRLFGWLGLRRDDRLFFPFSFGPFLGFWAGFEGANRLGNLCLAAGGMSTEARLRLLLDNQCTIVCCTPTYALRLIEQAQALGLDLAGSSVRGVLVAGEPGGQLSTTRGLIEAGFGARVFDHWGMTEVGPLAMEADGDPGGLWMLESDCIAEVIDGSTGLPVADGAEGELVVTTLVRCGMPLFRYRTGDRVRGERGSRDGLLRLAGGILGRVDEMLTIRGNNVYPSVLEELVRQQPGVAEFRVFVRNERAMQQLRVEVEPVAECVGPAVDRLVDDVARAIRERFHFRAEVEATTGLPRFEMKARRFFREPPLPRVADTPGAQ